MDAKVPFRKGANALWSESSEASEKSGISEGARLRSPLCRLGDVRAGLSEREVEAERDESSERRASDRSSKILEA